MRLILFFISAALVMAGQAFDVASIRPSQTPQGKGLPSLREDINTSPGMLRMQNVTLTTTIRWAYKLNVYEVTGPDWLANGRYEITAKADSAASEDQLRVMLQALLAERFKLVVRRESKEQQVYAIVTAKNGPKLEKSKLEEKDCQAGSFRFGDSTSCHSIAGGRGRGVHAEAVDLSDVANWNDHPVVDRSGLTGLFRINTGGWLPMEPRAAPSTDAKGEDGKLLVDQPTIFEIFERLGLKLELQRAPVEMFVIEHIEKLAEN
jgi:uncharacterized protein (TIGR03435 family)